ncbi:MAG TPA: ZIP family metal transporter [Verrucomicrobiae bacterium]|nr:ZIP family metal transporter [Verrucomicrobiae bacterium]
MSDSAAILWRVILAFGLAVAGGGISVLVGVSHKRLCGLISLAAGTLMGVTLFSILPEARDSMKLWELLVAFGSGYVLFMVISKYVYHVCPACAASHFDESTAHRFSEIATALIIALAIHSTMDGVALAAGHEAHETSGKLDLSVLLAVCVHKVPEGLALGALLLGAGFKRANVVLWVAAVEVTTVLGGVLGVWVLSDVSRFWLAAVLAHAGGGFIYLALHAVFGELLKHGKGVVITNFAAGVALIAVLNVVVRWL